MSLTTRITVSSVITYPLLALLLFWPAGDWSWWVGWSFMIFFTGGCVALIVWLLARNPALLEERMRIGANQKRWDKIFLGLIYLFFMAWWVVMPLDAVRFGWSHLAWGWRVAGVALTAASFYVLFTTFRENPFLSGVVRIQDDRGHRVISTGPYRFVRHPMYAGAALLVLGTPLWLGSWLGVAAGAALVLVLAVRAVLEERTLARELPGYDDYTRHVRRRMIPFVW